MRLCKICEQPFEARNGKHEICSDECRKKSHRIAVVKNAPTSNLKRREKRAVARLGYIPMLGDQICKISICDSFTSLNKKNVPNFYCKDCKVNGNMAREARLLKKYQMTMLDFNNMFESQGRGCAICQEIANPLFGGWHVDHDHKTGRVRGILCGKCNNGLGCYNDNPDLLIAAVAYLMTTEEVSLLKVNQPEKVGGEKYDR